MQVNESLIAGGWFDGKETWGILARKRNGPCLIRTNFQKLAKHLLFYSPLSPFRDIELHCHGCNRLRRNVQSIIARISIQVSLRIVPQSGFGNPRGRLQPESLKILLVSMPVPPLTQAALSQVHRGTKLVT